MLAEVGDLNSGALNKAFCIFANASDEALFPESPFSAINSLNSAAPSPLTDMLVRFLPAESLIFDVKLTLNHVGGQVNGLGEDEFVDTSNRIT